MKTLLFTIVTQSICNHFFRLTIFIRHFHLKCSILEDAFLSFA